jgi:lipid-binding SYLF domain-containing protein
MKKNRRQYFIVVCAAVFGTFFSSLLSPALSAEATEEQLLVDKARITFESFISDPNMSYLKQHLKEAKGILIVPSLLKAGFIFGGSGGSGVLIVNDAKKGQWSQPAFLHHRFRQLRAADRRRGGGGYHDGEDSKGC